MHWPRIIGETAEVCKKYPTHRKLLLIQNHHAGQLILQSVAKCAGGWLNLHAVTPTELAWSAIATEASTKGLDAADVLRIECIVLNAYNKVRRAFFPDNPPLGLISALTRTISELRIANVGVEELRKNKKLNPRKAEDIAAIMEGYVKELSGNSLLDEAGIYRFALAEKEPAGRRRSQFLIPSSLQITGLCKEFVQWYAAEDIFIINEDPVFGAARPADCFTESNAEAETELSYLFSSESGSRLPHSKAPSAQRIELFAAVGMRNEIREIYRRIVENKIPYDDMEIILPDYGAYAPALKDIAEEIGGIALTFGSGLPAFRSGPARCLAAFADWISNDFQEPLLRKMFADGSIRPPEGVSGRQTARILRSAQIGWGQQRYVESLDAYCNKIRERLQNPEDDDEKTLQERLTRAEKVRDHVRSILSELPGAGAPLEQYFTAAAAFLEEYAQIRSESDGGVLKRLLTMLKTAGGTPALPVFLRLQAIAGSVSTGASGAAPGCIHVAPVPAGGLSGRPYVFVPGLNERVYPGTIANDPILTDDERRTLSKALQVSADVSHARTFLFGQAFARIRGPLCLSYSTRNLADGTRLFPSPLLLQAHRLSTGNPFASYEELGRALEPPAGFIPERTPLGTDEWWLSHISFQGVLNDAQEPVLTAYSDLQSGRTAIARRGQPESGEFDGKLQPDPVFDLRKSGRAISATALENYAKCPRSFLFSHLLGIALPEEVTFEPGRWLDALQRGSLLHDFYCRFLTELKGRKEKRDPAGHQKRAAEVLDQVISEWKAQIPPPSDSVFDSERSELQRSISIFLREESRMPAFGQGTPEYFEISFGFKDSEKADPIEIKLPGGKSIRLRGRIDRIDRLAKRGAWAVWDYKTGRSTEYETGRYTAGGSQLQHILYACAAEQILTRMGEKNPVVAVSGYLFTTDRSDGNVCVPRDAGRRSEGLTVVKELLDAMSEGVFLGTGANCDYCNWGPCCHSNEQDRWEELSALNDQAANFIQKVQQHE